MTIRAAAVLELPLKETENRCAYGESSGMWWIGSPLGRPQSSRRHRVALITSGSPTVTIRLVGGVIVIEATNACGSSRRAGRPRDRRMIDMIPMASTVVPGSGSVKPAGDLGPEEDIDQVFFEVDAYLLYAHAAFAFRGDPEVLVRASEAVRRRLGGPAVTGRGPASS